MAGSGTMTPVEAGSAQRLTTSAIITSLVAYSGISRADGLLRTQAGYDRVLAGQDPRGGIHQWSFMVLTATQRLWADVLADDANTISGGTYNETNDQTPLTADSAAFHPYHVGYDLTLTDTGAVRIVGFTSSTVIILAGDQSAVDAETFTVTSGGRYLLPVDFGGFKGKPVLTFESGSGLKPPSLKKVSPEEIWNNRRFSANDGTPRRYAVAPASGTDWVLGSAQRSVLLVDPPPAVAWTVAYQYEVATNSLTDSESEYALGPAWMGRLYQAAALARSELLDNGTAGIMEQNYQREMVTMIDRDNDVLGTSETPSHADYDDGP